MKGSRFIHGSNIVRFAAAPAGDPAREGWPASGATPEHLAAINALPGVLKPLTAADVFVRECDAINTLVLKNGLHLGVSEIAQIAAQSPGKGVHVQHDTYTANGLPLGRIFAARIEQRDGVTHCVQTFYLTADNDNAQTVNRIDTGAISEVSVSFMYDWLQCSVCGNDMAERDPKSGAYLCPHFPLEQYAGATCYGEVKGVDEYIETSLVWQGMANETRIKMAAARQCLCGDSDLAEFLVGKPRAKLGRRTLSADHVERLAESPESGMGWQMVEIRFANATALTVPVAADGSFECPSDLMGVSITGVCAVSDLAELMRPVSLDAMFKSEPLESLFTK